MFPNMHVFLLVALAIIANANLSNAADGPVHFVEPEHSVFVLRAIGVKSHIAARDFEKIPDVKVVQKISIVNAVLDESAKRTLAQGTSVLEVTLEDVNVDDKDLAFWAVRWRKCRFLNLSGTDVTDDSVDTIASMSSLRRIVLYNASITQKGIHRLRELRPDLAIERQGSKE